MAFTISGTSGINLGTQPLAGVLPDANAPSGSVLQVVQASYSTPTATTSGSFVDTGLTASITPSSSTSKILVIVNQQIRMQKTGTTDTGHAIKIVRDSTTVFTRDDSGTASYYSTQLDRADMRYTNNMVYLDSPSSTSSVAYKTQFLSYNTSTVTAQNSSIPSTITLMEISA